MTKFIHRAYNALKLNEARGVITKSSKSDRLKDEINYYNSLPNNLAIYFPRLLDSYDRDNTHCMDLEYYTYSDVGKLMVDGDFEENKDTWRKIFRRTRDVLEEFQTYAVPGNQEHFKGMYIDKTKDEYNNLKQNFADFKDICSGKELIVNGKAYKNFEIVWPQIESLLMSMIGSPFNAMHGDMCFSNILYGLGENGIVALKFIDPRGRFGGPGYMGDYRYDFAKLIHSFEGGYEYIIRDSFCLNHDGNSITFNFLNDNRAAVKRVFYDVFGDANFFTERIKEFYILQGLIFIGMCARHYDSVKRQKIMYGTGVRILNEALN